MLGVTLNDRLRNSFIREKCGLKEDVVTRVEKGMLRWFGHVERMNDERVTKEIYRAKLRYQKCLDAHGGGFPPRSPPASTTSADSRGSIGQTLKSLVGSLTAAAPPEPRIALLLLMNIQRKSTTGTCSRRRRRQNESSAAIFTPHFNQPFSAVTFVCNV
ncbi:unnamed protein product [Plutella xylostella]|uniref:(diamondback moth) hypothetical protein n=1 Tax=Plutella xylostella TaxID=51655 RepID=A0A8S4FZX0_PLUXY|nr:unnamed protein product [Plutella xylostella]